MLRLSELSGFIVCDNRFRKNLWQNLARKPQKKTPSHRNYGEGGFYEYLRVGSIYKTTNLAKLENYARPE